MVGVYDVGSMTYHERLAALLKELFRYGDSTRVVSVTTEGLEHLRRSHLLDCDDEVRLPHGELRFVADA